MGKLVFLTRVSTDDYETLYLDGELILAEHRIDLVEALKALIGHRILGITDYYIDGDVLECKYDCAFPSKLSDYDSEDLTT